MNILGYNITRTKATPPSSLNSITAWGGWLGNLIREPFSGAWQRNIQVEDKQTLLAFSAVFACVALLADDVAKLCINLSEKTDDGIWTPVDRNSPYWPVFIQPNGYQTRQQFFVQWMVSKLLYGNTYTYILRELNRGQRIPTKLYVLDPRSVTPLITAAGDVWYRLNRDPLAAVTETDFVVPASEIMHDRGLTLFHPLIGVSPLYACGTSGTQGLRIQNNSAVFFENMSRPSGQLTAPGTISDETAARLKTAFEAATSGGNVGRLFVAGDGLTYEPIGIPASDAQLIEQLKWTTEDVARCFKVPPYKIGAGAEPKFTNYAALNQDYYSQTLQAYLEAIESLLDIGLGLKTVTGREYRAEFDLDDLLRMDQITRSEYLKTATGTAWMSPNEARSLQNYPPVKGGESPMAQQQNFPLDVLAERPPPATAPLVGAAAGAATPALPAPTRDFDIEAFELLLSKELELV